MKSPIRNLNVPILSLSQAVALSGGSMVVLLGGLIGREIAPSPALATLPLSLMVVGLALSSLPAAFFMQRFGRQRGFITFAILAVLAALLAAYAIAIESFLLFCSATLMLGMHSAFVQQYRFAAAESVTPERVGQAVSYVLIGGIVAGVIGPELGKRASTWLPYGLYTGSFVVLAIMFMIVVVMMLFFRNVTQKENTVSSEVRPLLKIISQPEYLIAVLSAAVGYGVMSFIMTATPINMQTTHGFVLGQTTLVIQSHVLGMYIPSLFSGWLIARLGVVRLMLVGAFTMLICVALALAGTTFMNFWGALVLLGIGWNFLFVGGTTLLTQTYKPAERFKSQAVNDFVVFGSQAIASLSSGTLLYLANWNSLILISLPFLLIVLVALVILRRLRGRETTQVITTG